MPHHAFLETCGSFNFFLGRKKYFSRQEIFKVVGHLYKSPVTLNGITGLFVYIFLFSHFSLPYQSLTQIAYRIPNSKPTHGKYRDENDGYIGVMHTHGISIDDK